MNDFDRFQFPTTDGGRVDAPPVDTGGIDAPAMMCTSDDQCNDGDACTVDTCDGTGFCSRTRMAIEGDACEAPIYIGAPGLFTGDTSCANSDFDSECSLSAAGPDVFFHLPLPADTVVELDARGSSFRPVLSVGTGCGSLDACNKDGQPVLSLTLPAGDYYLGLDGPTETDRGPWQLSVSFSTGAGETIVFPSVVDAHVSSSLPAYYIAGDYIEGTRTTSVPSLSRVEMVLAIASNGLSCDNQDSRLMINGVEIGRYSVTPTAATVMQAFTGFGAIGGPTYTIRIETVRTVTSGCGAAGYTDDVSTFRLFM